MSKVSTTAIACRIEELHDIKQLALDLGREQRRTVPLWEVVRLLLDTYRQAPAAGRERTAT